jgi:RNA polymerase sigma-70 factor (ECF subfamily)
MAMIERAPTARDLEARLEDHRLELTGYCYRMLGSAFESEDAVQETMVRAWRNLARFEGRSALRSWLYSIATNVCLDMLDGRKRRARPMDFGGPGAPEIHSLGDQLPEATWILPIPDSRLMPEGGDPSDVAAARETIQLAFIAALQHLPAKQRAVLILREVLRWKATEVAELLDTSVASVNSALQRARATLDSSELTPDTVSEPVDDEQRKLAARYAEAFERYDMDALTALLHEDATLSMPPYALWLRGHEDIRAWMVGPGFGCEGSRMIPTMANGSLAFGQYRPSGPGGLHEPWALQVIEVSGGWVTAINAFLDMAHLFPLFGLPLHPDA